jgi:phosphoenolpyruvate carboxykinase (GTP)
MRVLKWMIDRIEGRAGGFEHVFGTTPRYEDLHWDGLSFSREAYERITSIDRGAWEQEFRLHGELFERLDPRLPEALARTKARFEERLAD